MATFKALEENLTTEDCEHFSVNQMKNFVDSDTGAYTQTVEGMYMWRHMKAFLPDFGLRPQYLDSYFGTFIWLRYTKQRKMNPFNLFSGALC